MPHFRKTTVVIEAVQLTWSNWSQICDFVPKPWFVRGVWLDAAGNPLPDDKWRFGENNEDLGLILRTLESDQSLARGNDWIIKGVNGEFYSCKPDVFDKTYEPVDDDLVIRNFQEALLEGDPSLRGIRIPAELHPDTDSSEQEP